MDGRGNRRNAINRRKFKRYIRRRMRRWSERGLMAVSVVLALITVISGGAFLLDSRAKAQEPEFQGAKVIQAFTTESAKEKPAEQNSPLVVLDAGHGGNDQGTCAGDILEKDINLSIVKKLAKKLEAEGATVLLTRDDDFKVGLEGRANIANDAGADFFISIHCNLGIIQSLIQTIAAQYLQSFQLLLSQFNIGNHSHGCNFINQGFQFKLQILS